ncbi:MAG: hypothetical protein BWY68_00629 [bacterium ADurb.Bin400]|nr:MAG: hypothetical protein BWY68_00629 [bacterium ADurb.Bin400]
MIDFAKSLFLMIAQQKRRQAGPVSVCALAMSANNSATRGTELVRVVASVGADAPAGLRDHRPALLAGVLEGVSVPRSLQSVREGGTSEEIDGAALGTYLRGTQVAVFASSAVAPGAQGVPLFLGGVATMVEGMVAEATVRTGDGVAIEVIVSCRGTVTPVATRFLATPRTHDMWIALAFQNDDAVPGEFAQLQIGAVVGVPDVGRQDVFPHTVHFVVWHHGVIEAQPEAGISNVEQGGVELPAVLSDIRRSFESVGANGAERESADDVPLISRSSLDDEEIVLVADFPGKANWHADSSPLETVLSG